MRRNQDSLTSTKIDAPSPDKPKRQRVSVACNACRTSREKCDGFRPGCGNCVKHRRRCVYAPATKKRGLQTGYLRTLELSLTWILDNVDNSQQEFMKFLRHGDGSRVLVDKGGRAGDKLHRRWAKNQVNAELGNLLSGKGISAGTTEALSEISEEDTEPEASDTISPPIHTRAIHRQRASDDTEQSLRIQLPPNWSTYMDIYFSYTHSWLPIMDRHDLSMTIASYGPAGLSPEQLAPSKDQHAELWAVLAVASLQYSSSSNLSQSNNSNRDEREQIYCTAKKLLPTDDSSFSLRILRALILHSLIFIGAGNLSEAWYLLGRISRVLLLHPDRGGSSAGLESAPVNATVAACFYLDTFVALGLGQQPVLCGLMETTHIFDEPLTSTIHDEGEPWAPVPGFGPVRTTAHQNITSCPSLCLYQLMDFSVAVCKTKQRQTDHHQSNNVLRYLNTQFSFCNSLLSQPAPTIPASFLVNIFFIISSIESGNDYRISLLSTLSELMQSCRTTFGDCGTPPLVVAAIAILKRQQKYMELSDSDKRALNDINEALQLVWRVNRSSEDARRVGPNEGGNEPALSNQYNNNQIHERESMQMEEQHIYTSHRLRTSTIQRRSMYRSSTEPVPQDTDEPLQMQESPTDEEVRGNSDGQVEIDYDAIMRDMDAIQYLDNVGLDAQFMANLGFAPGCDLADAFNDDFGT